MITLSFTTEEDDDLECSAQEQEERHMTMIGFEFPLSLKNSATAFQATVRQPGTTYLIDGPTRPPIGITSSTTRSSVLALSEIRTTMHEESAWSSVAIGKRSIPLAGTQRSTGPRQQYATSLHQVALHLSLDFSTVRP
jgi:hypothetical protein